MRRLLGLGLTAFAASVFFALSAGQALANHVECGGVITRDTTLDSDLIDCPGDGIVLAANDITLDLNGHTIDGITTSPFHGARGVVGTTNASCPNGCSSGVTIENGSIREFSYAIELNPAGASIIRGLTLSDTYGIELGFGDGMRIERNSLQGGSIYAGDSNATLIEHNVVSGGGIGITGGSHARVARNSVSDSPHYGIALGDGSDHALLRNVLSTNRVGIQASSSAYRIRMEGNSLHENLEDGIRADDCYECLVRRNVANGNGDDGIYVAQGDTEEFGPGVVTKNIASYNADFGIEVQGAGVLDGGGNRAFGNGNPLQCLHVVCRTTGPKK
jgi:parallel beta-helix repeat protein